MKGFSIVYKKNHPYLRMTINGYDGEGHVDHRIYGANTENPYVKVAYLGRVDLNGEPELMDELRKCRNIAQ